MPKFKPKKTGYYILDVTHLIDPKPIALRFFDKEAARLYIQRRFKGDDKNYKVLSAKKLLKFKVFFKKVKRRFYSKYAIPDRQILTAQGKKSFRTLIRFHLYGRQRIAKYSAFCDICCKYKQKKIRNPDNNPKFAKKRDYLFNGKSIRLCKTCHNLKKPKI